MPSAPFNETPLKTGLIICSFLIFNYSLNITSDVSKMPLANGVNIRHSKHEEILKLFSMEINVFQNLRIDV